MMNFKRPRISIKIKIWLSTISIVVTVIAAIWFLQVVYLEDYYLRIKKNEFSDIVTSVKTTIDQEGIEGSQEALYNIASKHTLCIDISSTNGKRMVTYEGLGYNCYIHSNEAARRAFLIEALKNPNSQNIKNIIMSDTKTEFLIGTGVGTSKENVQYIVVVSITLAPVREAAEVIRNQLVLISLLLIFFATVFAFFIARSLTKPIVKISNAAREIANGNLDVQVQVKGNNELSDLSDSFSYMTKELSKVNVLQKELIANISHDIRTPLTMIKGYAEAIKDITGDNKEQREQQLGIIVDEANRLNTLVNDVMDLSLMQAGQSPLNIGEFSITSKISDILSRFKLLEQTKGFEFKLCAEDNYIVSADEVRIEQVLYNLINNAVNHIGENKIITVSITKENDEIMISVEDTGTGIKKEDLPLIWDRYYKPYKKTEQKAMGTGLGLSIVKAILINHNSRFGVVSTLGVGSKFWFTLKEKTIDK